MMASRILSRFLPNTESDSLRHDHPIPEIEIEGHTDHELDALLADAADDEMVPLDAEDHVPNSLLIEPGLAPTPSSHRPSSHGPSSHGPSSHGPSSHGPSSHGPSSHGPRHNQTPATQTEEQWIKAQDRQPLHTEHPPAQPRASQQAINAKEQAIWKWTNVQNLDAFLLELYDYYVEHGIWSILLSRAINLATTAFLFSLYVFLSSCIDYSKIPTSKSTAEVLVPKCMQNTSFATSLLLWCFTFWWAWMLFKHVMDIRRLWSLHQFYHHLLNIPDTDLQTVTWERIVEGLMALRNANPRTAETLPRYIKQIERNQSKQRMDAHDIANRLMRRDNYFIALFNKEIFDLSLPVPFLGTRQFYSKSLEFCIQFCFQDFIFDNQGQVKPSCVNRRDRDHLISTLRRRLRFTAIMSIILAPVNVGAHCIYYFSRYYAEYRNSPSKLSARAFTPLAEWKFREFNELEHDFRLRMRMSYSFADDYLNQFPRDKTHQFLQFVSLVSGTLAGLLGLATILDPDLFLGFEITPGRTAFFYISILMAIFAGARGSVPDEGDVHEPVLHLMNVMQMTHYQPTRGRNQLHSNDVKVEFSSLYQMRVLIFLEEIMSLFIAPFILWKNSGKRSETIIDFFRNSTVQVDGLGHLCTFSVFDFRKSKNVEDDRLKDVEGLREEYFGTKDDKMAKSQAYFMERLSGYDQKRGGARHHRPYYGINLPPAFPPMSPMRRPNSGRAHFAEMRSGHAVGTARGGRSSSPTRSILLDPQPHRPLNVPTGTSARSSSNSKKHGLHALSARTATQRGGAVNMADYLSPDEGDEDEAAAARFMTTSRLIEEDTSLDDSWKNMSRKNTNTDVQANSISQNYQGTGDGGGGGDKKQDGGVLGLLVEYSKAAAGGKGPKIG